MPNTIAFIALALWPVATFALFARMQADRALIWSLMLGYLFLPEPPAAFDLPLMPPLGKHNIPALAALLVMVQRSGFEKPILPTSPVGRFLLLVFVFTPLMTTLTNGEPVFFGRVGLPGLAPKDGVALVLQQFLLIVPFLLARQLLGTGKAQREILLALAIGGLAYSLLMLIELRLSPQLNLWVYGYYQHFFEQSVRAGGYRPVVFLYHGLWVAFFCMTAAVSAWALWRHENGSARRKWLLSGIYLSAVLVLSNSLGALIFLVLLVPLVVLLSPRKQVLVAVLIGVMAIGYPLLKGAGMVPQERLLEYAERIDPDRAASLEFRFTNEQTLLDRAYFKPVFGWGSWGRNHILDPDNGNILTVTDGRWIIVIGTYGWVGFLAEFGMLLWPLVLIWRIAANRANYLPPWIGPLSLLLAVNMFDMIPNATLTPLTWLIAGALTGFAEAPRREVVAERVIGWKPVI